MKTIGCCVPNNRFVLNLDYKFRLGYSKDYKLKADRTGFYV